MSKNLEAGVLLNIVGVGVVHWWSKAPDEKPFKRLKSLRLNAEADGHEKRNHHEATEVYIDDEYWLLGDGNE